jgi:hypothetical protein
MRGEMVKSRFKGNTKPVSSFSKPAPEQQNNNFNSYGNINSTDMLGMGLDYFGNKVLLPAIEKAQGDISEVSNIGKSAQGTLFGGLAIGSLVNPSGKSKAIETALESVDGKAIRLGTDVIKEADKAPIWEQFQEALKIARDSKFNTGILDFSNTVLSPTQATPKRIREDIARIIAEKGGSLGAFSPLGSGGYSVSGESAALRDTIKGIQGALPSNVGGTIAASMKDAGIDPSIAVHLAQHGERGLDIPYRLFDNIDDVILAVDNPVKFGKRMDNAFTAGRESYESILKEIAGIEEKLPKVSTTLDTSTNLRDIIDSSFGGIAPNAGRVVDKAGNKISELSTLLIRPGEHGVGKSGHAVESAAESIIDPSQELRQVRRLEAEFINNPNINGESINAIVNAIKAGHPIDRVVDIIASTKKLSPQEANSFIQQHFGETAQGEHYRSIDTGFKAIREAAGVKSPLDSIPSYNLNAVKTVLDSKLQMLRKSNLSNDEKAKQVLILQKEFVDSIKNMAENSASLF